jgi:hypothetical protein
VINPHASLVALWFSAAFIDFFSASCFDDFILRVKETVHLPNVKGREDVHAADAYVLVLEWNFRHAERDLII